MADFIYFFLKIRNSERLKFSLVIKLISHLLFNYFFAQSHLAINHSLCFSRLLISNQVEIHIR